MSNLTISCRKCNLEKGTQTAEEFGYPHIQQQAKTSLRAPSGLNTIRWRLVEQLGAEHTYGYVTKYERNKLGLEKSHINDAFVIAGGTDQERCRPYELIQVRRNNRSLQTNRKGYKRAIRKNHYDLQPYDLVKYNNRFYRVKGAHCYGKRVILENPKGKNLSVAIKKAELIKYGKGLLFTFKNT